MKVKVTIEATLKSTDSKHTSYDVMSFTDVMIRLGQVLDPLGLKFTMDKKENKNKIKMKWNGECEEAALKTATNKAEKLVDKIDEEGKYEVIKFEHRTWSLSREGNS